MDACVRKVTFSLQVKVALNRLDVYFRRRIAGNPTLDHLEKY
jgi:hypothetical protein